MKWSTVEEHVHKKLKKKSPSTPSVATSTMPPKKKKNRNFSSKHAGSNKELLFAEEDQMYALVENALGDRRFTVQCSDGVNRLGKLRGSIRRSNFVRKGSFVLISCRHEDTKVDIIHHYCETHTVLLHKYNELESFKARKPVQGEEDDLVQFEDDDDDFVGDI